jgi:phosphoribosylformylglycinamidine synthase
MLWEVEVRPADAGRGELDRVAAEFDLLTHSGHGRTLLTAAGRGYLLEGDLDSEADRHKLIELLTDPVIEAADAGPLNHPIDGDAERAVTVLLKPGVMDPTAQSVLAAAADLGVKLSAVRTYRRYRLAGPLSPEQRVVLFHKVLANPAIEQVVEGPLAEAHLTVGKPYQFRRVDVPLRDLDNASLERLSREGQLALNLAEMKSVQAHFREQGREPTDLELETVAQTWSEHCSHKTLKGIVEFTHVTADGREERRRYQNLLKETIFAATQEIRRRLGPDDWCVSVFEDNAGVVKFTDEYHACFKVETHNRPSAIEPYAGANTGLGGVIRDPLGTGLGAKPVANTDVFCFASPDMPPEELPPGVLHPRKVMAGVVAGVRDYGNRVGIPTVNGAVVFDDRYLANPLVFCGTLGLIPVDRAQKAARPGDLIVTVGGRTGRDGIHGATFSSLELTDESESVSGGAVQLGNPIAEKKMLDVVLQARDRGLYSAITDCGAGGFSSAVGEMAAEVGAIVYLDRAPLKYEGLSYTEIWISESQERMVLAVPPERWPALQRLCRSEDVEAAALGEFEATGRLRLLYQGQGVGNLDLHFLHDGRPKVVRQAVWRAGGVNPSPERERRGQPAPVAHAPGSDHTQTLLRILSSYSVCSKEWVIRQYDHEVQGGSVIKPLVGASEDGPGDASVVAPVLGSWAGLALGCGLNPRYGDLDPYAMAAAAIDEAVRNVVAVGADPARVALLDNFCWGNTDRPEVFGSLVRAAEACRDVALAFTMPFISGKDSLKNEYRGPDRHIVIPPTLLISALGLVPDVRQCVTMDLKEPGNALYLVGLTRNELGGSHNHLVHGLSGGEPPRVDVDLAPRLFRALHQAINRGLVRACHDLSEGGLAVAAAEMAFAGEVGAELTDLRAVAPGEPDVVRLFSESPTRWLVEVRPDRADEFRGCLTGLPAERVGRTVAEPRLRIAVGASEWLIDAALTDLKEAWQSPLRW